MNRKRIAAIIATATIVGGIYINPVIAHADNINNVANIKVQEQNNSNITNNIDAYDQASYISLNNITFTSDKDISGKYLYVEVEGYGQVTVGEIKTTMIDGVKHYIVPKAENGNDIPVNKPLNVKFYIANSQFKQFDLSKCTLAYEAKGVEFHALDVFKMNIKSGLPEEYNGKNVYYSLNPLSTTSQVNEIKKLKQVKIGKDGTVNVYTNSQSAGDIYFYVKNKEGKFTRYFAQYLPGAVNYTIKKLDYYQDAGNGTYLTSKMPSSFVCPENQAWVVMGNGMININLTPGQIPDSSKIKTTISIEGSNGKAIGTPESATGEPGDKINLKTPEIPEGYHLVNITDNGKVVKNAPSTFGDSDDNIIYHVAKNPNITVKVVDSKGKELGNSEVVTGDPSSKVIAKVPSIPKGYHLVNVTNGEGEIVNGIPSTFGDKDETIIYHVEKNPTKTIISIEGSDDKVIGTPESATGEPGDKTNLKDPQIPEGYHLVNITDNGKVITNVPNTFGDSDDNIIYHVEKNPTKTIISIEGSNGKVIGTPESATGEPGDKTNLKDPQIPEGYHLVNITDNGKVITNVPSTFGDNNDNIIYHVAKNPSITVKVIDSKGKELGKSEIVTGDPSSKVTAKVPSIPEGYHLVNVTNSEGKTVNGIPSTFGDKDEIIIYHVEKNPTKTTISIEGSDNKVIGTPESATGEPGDKINLKTPEVPNGYHLVNITDNGKVITKIPNTFGDSDYNIIYHVAKNPNITIKVIDANGKEIGTPKVVTGTPNAKVTVKTPSIPSGYHLVKVTNGEGQTVNGIPSIFGNENETIEYHIAKDIKNNSNGSGVKNIKVSIENDKGEPIGIPRVISGVKGEKANVPIPTIPEGYKLNNITINGVKVHKMPNIFGNVNGNVVLHVSKSENSENPKTGDTSNIPEVAGILGSLALLLGINLKKKNPVTK
ncbi:MucBP domain-containing protein [Clostridium thermobutyricum]|uniref:MucBP domain-containing protein n=1 Tax=Clostridium thermobutyricum DSM 4928 TaxID=1121339 RepID=A0A1V4SXC1_9CLOT|nr:MucBP domain-containing protein [Clostridium thermobutyricum]OPX48403.1 hypothetical protein CLTHE_12260 [Clostridium thermobutyricum DSM 4928]